MVKFDFLYKGLCGMARAHRANAMTGHLGAAVVAAYFFGEDQPDLDDQVCRGIESEVASILAGEESWFDPKKAGIEIPELFEPFPEQRPQKELIATIAQALAGNIDRTRESGHNVIFASIAIRGLSDHPQYATPALVGGICKLIEAFDGVYPGRGYYGKQRGWIGGNEVSLAATDPVPPYADQAALAATVADELARVAASRRQGFGGLWHIINHAAGLVELALYGYKDLASKGFDAHRQHVCLWRSLPDVADELGPLTPAQHDPRTAAFWTSGPLYHGSARLTHRIKTLYGFYKLAPLIKDQAKRKGAETKLRYLM